MGHPGSKGELAKCCQVITLVHSAMCVPLTEGATTPQTLPYPTPLPVEIMGRSGIPGRQDSESSAADTVVALRTAHCFYSIRNLGPPPHNKIAQAVCKWVEVHNDCVCTWQSVVWLYRPMIADSRVWYMPRDQRSAGCRLPLLLPTTPVVCWESWWCTRHVITSYCTSTSSASTSAHNWVSSLQPSLLPHHP